MKVLFTENYGEEKFQKIRDLGYDLMYIPERKIENNDEINLAQVLVTYNPFSNLDIDKMKNLRYIQITSVGIDQVPKRSIIENDILLANNRGGYSIPMGEWIVMYILEIYKNTMNLYNQQLNKIWRVDYSVEELCGKTIGFIGTGTIATEAAKRLKAFEVEIWGVNTKGRDTDYFDRCFSTEDMDIVFRECDVVVVTIPSTKETIGMINDNKFKIMKDNSVFINVGRGNIIHEDDLIKNIRKFKGVALDVFEEEPLSTENSLWQYENVIITPHNSWISNMNKDRTFNTIYSNLKSYIQGKNINNIVDIKKGY
ncbi:dihydrofolate reductase [Romboutsia weinsteinii]|uniref:Dihydrofolate reductase n=1 Tax=Romboutsia weinsteinii TaxID=2020949 RepID=A0A371J1E2_9FIRM|nr:phosphoglycerate dehydrogenase [Romboutsia weinsteinii]RDY26621.1 dihydrofolate reductase [Romboutsia weinsteinii]